MLCNILQKSQNLIKYPCDSFREVGSHITKMVDWVLKTNFLPTIHLLVLRDYVLIGCFMNTGVDERQKFEDSPQFD